MERLAWLLEGVTSGVPSVASAFVFLAFGGAAAWLLGIRSRLLLVVAALPVGIGLLALTSQVVGGLGLQTSIVIQAGVALGVAALLATMRWLRTRKASSVRTTTAPPGPIVWAGAALGSAIAMGVWLAGIGDFGLPPQGNDDIWHGYVVERLIHMPAITADTVAGTVCIFLTGLYHAEQGIAGRLQRLTSGPLLWAEIDADKALPWIESKTGLTLAASQAEAIRLALRSKALVITGGPGVGKTTIVNSILRILAAKSVKLLLCAPCKTARSKFSV